MANSFRPSQVDTRKLRQIIESMPRGEAALLAGIANEMVVDVQLSMDDSPADGRTYKRGTVEHVASSAGNPPRPDTGTLRASINHAPRGNLEEVIFDQVEYGYYLEFGTEDILPRPFMRPVFEAWSNRKFADFVRSYPLVR